MKTAYVATAVLALAAGLACAEPDQPLADIKLPVPRMEGGKPLMAALSPEDQALYNGADTGFISQNVYLFCASEGLATVVRGLVDRPALAKALNLPDSPRIVLTQTVGYPAAEGP